MTKLDIQQLFAYTEWANALVLEAAARLTREQLNQDRQISHGSIMGTLLHMAGAEWVWLERWHGRSHTGPEVWQEWSVEGGHNLTTLRARWEQLDAERRALLETTREEALSVPLSFKRVNGEDFSLPLGQQMQHVVNHSTLHRGQVVGMIRQLGIIPPATDYLFYLR